MIGGISKSTPPGEVVFFIGPAADSQETAETGSSVRVTRTRLKRRGHGTAARGDSAVKTLESILVKTACHIATYS